MLEEGHFYRPAEAGKARSELERATRDWDSFGHFVQLERIVRCPPQHAQTPSATPPKRAVEAESPSVQVGWFCGDSHTGPD
jgi:hypothetical protein